MEKIVLPIGNTPLYQVKSFQSDAKIFAKLEWYNLTGSVKDRPAYKILCDAKANGLKDGSCVIEATSGNMGISFAAICRPLNLQAVIVLPENMSEERKKIIRAYSAELVETPASEGMGGAVKRAEQLHLERKGSFMPRQFENELNAEAHYLTTGPEIFAQTGGKVDAFVCGIGTGGTISGVAKFLKEKNPEIKIIGVEPLSSPLLSQGKFGSHKIQGIGANFVPTVLKRELIDEIIDVSNEDAYTYARQVCEKEALMVGISSGAALCASVEYAKRAENAGKTIVTLFPDSGMKYLSTELYK